MTNRPNDVDTDRIEAQLRAFYEAEADRRLRPSPGERRRRILDDTADRFATDGVRCVLDVGSGPGGDGATFEQFGIEYIGIDLAIGNARIADEARRTVVPASLFALPFASGSLPACWSMSTLQHVPDDRIDDALAELVRVLRPGAPVVLGLWGGRDEVIESPWATTGVDLPRHFTLRSHDRIDEIVARHLRLDRSEIFPAGPSDWEYHVTWAHTS